jgi:hypothetical protein
VVVCSGEQPDSIASAVCVAEGCGPAGGSRLSTGCQWAGVSEWCRWFVGGIAVGWAVWWVLRVELVRWGRVLLTGGKSNGE